MTAGAELTIAAVEVQTLRLRFRENVAPHMARAITHGPTQRLCRVTLANGAEGWGDGGATAGAWVGRSAVEALRHGAEGGLQMACYDAVGRSLGVPAHVLMGQQVRAAVPWGYWSIDLPPETLREEAARAVALGCRLHKAKCRPWWDPVAQAAAVQEVVPPGYALWLDFNGHLGDAGRALPLLRELEAFPCVAGFESPLPQRDLAGYRALQRQLTKPLALHFGGGCCHVRSDPGFDPGLPPAVWLAEGLGAAFVLGSAAVEWTRKADATLAEFRKRCWLQVPGTALRGAWILHLAATCGAAQLGNLAAHELWEEDVTTLPPVTGGARPVPRGCGLGVAVDREAVARLAAQGSAPAAPRRHTVRWADGTAWSGASEWDLHEAFYRGDLPGFQPGVRLEMEVGNSSP